MALPPGPRTPALIQTIGLVRDFEGYMSRCLRRYGNVFTVKFMTMGNLVYLADPDDIKSVFRGDPATFRAGEANQVMEPVLGTSSVLLLDGETHLQRRRLLLPPFHGESIARYEELIAEIARWEVGRWPLGRPFALRPRMQAITLEVILRAVFGIREAARLERLRTLLPELLEQSGVVMWVPFLRNGLGPWSPLRRFERTRSAIDEILYDEIARRRAGNADGDDILSLLLRARDEDGNGMTDAELRDELMTMVTAGHETTATALSWAFDLLLHHPEQLRRLEDELAGDEDGYLEAVVKETLRVRPVVPDVARVLAEPVEVAGHLLPAGTHVVPAITIVQKLGDTYPDAREFRPERFQDGQPAPYTWIPFGGGTRRCIGAAFAQLEMTVVMRTIAQSVQMEAAEPEAEHIGMRAIVLAPKQGSRVVVSPKL
jgi:cytochrome P450 family 135